MPGYLTLPRDGETTFEDYMKTRQFKPLRPGQTSYWQNYRKFMVSFQKALYGDAAQAGNDWAYDWLPKLDIPLYDIIKAFEMMANGQMNGYICQGFNPLQAFPDKGKIRKALGKLKFLVTMDPLDTETSRFWENFGPQNPSDPAAIQTEVFQLPTTCFAEEDGALVNSARWLQWHWKAADPPGEAKPDIWIMSGIFHRMREMYRKDGGAFPDPLLNLAWNYTDPTEPSPEDVAKDMNGRALVDLKDQTGAVTTRAGQLLDGFAQLRDDGTTASGCWIFSGCYTEKGNQMARRDATDPREQGIAPNWAWAWPANRRILYNRASADVAGKAWNPAKPIIEWNGSRWVGIDVPDYGPTTKPSDGVGPFIMNAEGVGRFFARDQMAEGPFPEHYEPFESPVPNLLHPKVQYESGGARIRRRSGGFWNLIGLPLCRHHLPADRTFPLLDQACADQRDPAAGGVHRNRRGAGERKGNRASRLGPPDVEARRRRMQGLCDQTHPSVDGGRQADACDRRADPLGLHRPGAQGLRRQYADSVRWRRQYADPGVQGVPCERRANHSTGGVRRSARWRIFNHRITSAARRRR